MKTTDWSPILSTLSSARSFEEAAEAALDAAIAIAGRALEGSAFAGKGKVLRGIVHIRPGGGYRHVFQVEAGASSAKGRAGGGQSEAAASRGVGDGVSSGGAEEAGPSRWT
ncbi:MAG: hypothetical protein R3F14_26330 [Polyangiaceae bacterium]